MNEKRCSRRWPTKATLTGKASKRFSNRVIPSSTDGRLNTFAEFLASILGNVTVGNTTHLVVNHVSTATAENTRIYPAKPNAV
ncbi:hypothetical protein JCM31271_31100 [Halorubrum trueperi]